jgi:hypothetical protein
MSNAHLPQESHGVTGADGVGKLRAAAYQCDGVMVDANAKGYFAASVGVPVEIVDKIKPVSLFAPEELQPVSVVVEMFAEPHPQIELVVPTGFRGLIRAEVNARESIAPQPGVRHFRYELPPAGVVQIDGSLLFKHVDSSDFCCRYADGTEVPHNELGTLDVGLRWLTCDGNKHLFVIGTLSDYDRIRRNLRIPPGHRPAHATRRNQAYGRAP